MLRIEVANYNLVKLAIAPDTIKEKFIEFVENLEDINKKDKSPYKEDIKYLISKIKLLMDDGFTYDIAYTKDDIYGALLHFYTVYEVYGDRKSVYGWNNELNLEIKIK